MGANASDLSSVSRGVGVRGASVGVSRRAMLCWSHTCEVCGQSYPPLAGNRSHACQLGFLARVGHSVWLYGDGFAPALGLPVSAAELTRIGIEGFGSISQSEHPLSGSNMAFRWLALACPV